MTRTQAIAIITERLASATDETVQSVVDMLQSTEPRDSVLPRPLTPRELALIEQSKADFAEGRTLSPDELHAFLDAAADQRARARRQ